jgi:hypothetical protein
VPLEALSFCGPPDQFILVSRRNTPGVLLHSSRLFRCSGKLGARKRLFLPAGTTREIVPIGATNSKFDYHVSHRRLAQPALCRLCSRCSVPYLVQFAQRTIGRVS